MPLNKKIRTTYDGKAKIHKVIEATHTLSMNQAILLLDGLTNYKKEKTIKEILKSDRDLYVSKHGDFLLEHPLYRPNLASEKALWPFLEIERKVNYESIYSPELPGTIGFEMSGKNYEIIYAKNENDLNLKAALVEHNFNESIIADRSEVIEMTYYIFVTDAKDYELPSDLTMPYCICLEAFTEDSVIPQLEYVFPDQKMEDLMNLRQEEDGNEEE